MKYRFLNISSLKNWYRNVYLQFFLQYMFVMLFAIFVPNIFFCWIFGQVDQIRFRYYNKKLSLEAQLKTLVSTQLKDAKDGMDSLSDAIKLLQKMKKKLDLIFFWKTPLTNFIIG